MNTSLYSQISGVLYSIAFGGVLGFVYSIVRIPGGIFQKSFAVSLITDILFFMVSIILIFLFTFVFLDGNLTPVYFLIIIVGLVLYYFSFGKLLKLFCKITINAIKNLFFNK